MEHGGLVLEQVVRRVELLDAALVQDEDAVVVQDRVQPVRDRQDGAAPAREGDNRS